MNRTSLHLFAGIGSCALGFQRAGFTPIGFADNHPHAQAVLRRHWPDAQHFSDVRDLKASDLDQRPAVITGGFPCQDISLAGSGVGITGSRSSMWFEQFRLVKEVRPDYAVVENSPALRRRGLEEILRGFASIGYDAEWHCIPASHFGAPHRRDRIWIVAYPNGEGLEILLSKQIEKQQPPLVGASGWAVEPDVGRVAYGVARRVDRITRLGNSCVPVIPELIARSIIRKELLS